MSSRKWILKIPNRENNTDELPHCENKRRCEAGALCGEDKHGEDADILETNVGQEVQHHDGGRHAYDGYYRRGRRQADTPVMENVWRKQQEKWEW